LIFSRHVVLISVKKQVEIFQALLLDAKAAGQKHGDRSLHTAISEAQAVVDELLSFISQKLMRQGRDSYQARRKAWLRQKSKVVALGDRLKEARENVSLALNTGILYVMCLVTVPADPDARWLVSDNIQDQQHIGSIQSLPILTAGWEILRLGSNVLLPL
jgi:hypothetical protein